jgi:ABC-type multidrug transport system ATPase subunit
MPALRVTGLSKAYAGRSVLQGVDLAAEAGEVVALLGPNGTGKTTLLGCVTGAVIPDAGTIEIGGHDLMTAPLAARAALRALPQEVEVPEGLTGRELIEFFAQVFEDPSGQARALELADLGPAIDALATTYSVGMRKRLMFAALMLGPARLLALDEPFAGVDREGRGRMVAALDRARAQGAAVLLSAHDEEDVAGLGLSARGVRLR